MGDGNDGSAWVNVFNSIGNNATSIIDKLDGVEVEHKTDQNTTMLLLGGMAIILCVFMNKKK